MNKALTIIIPAIAIIILAAILIISTLPSIQQTPSGELDFVVSGTSECLRFLNASVPTVYVPFTIPANENWQLTINATKIPGGANGWTDVYIYKGYWNEGINNTCRAEQIYPIINKIESADFEIKANQPFKQTFGESTQQSYTVFFVIPPGGLATFHVTLKQI